MTTVNLSSNSGLIHDKYPRVELAGWSDASSAGNNIPLQSIATDKATHTYTQAVSAGHGLYEARAALRPPPAAAVLHPAAVTGSPQPASGASGSGSLRSGQLPTGHR